MSPAAPCTVVVFGGTGDLAVRKLLPALYLRDRDGQLPPGSRIVGAARAGLDTDGYRDKIRGELARFVPAPLLDAGTLTRFLDRLDYVSLDFAGGDDWSALHDVLTPDSVRVFYLASGATCLRGRSCSCSRSRTRAFRKSSRNRLRWCCSTACRRLARERRRRLRTSRGWSCCVCGCTSARDGPSLS